MNSNHSDSASSKSTYNSNSDKGFTLAELLVSIAILAVLATLAIPSFNNLLDRQAISQQAWEVRRALELARGLAVAEQQVWKVCMADLNLQCVKQQGQRLLVFRDSNNDHLVNGQDKLQLNLQIQSRNIRLSASGRSYIRFKGSGEALDSGNFLFCGNDKSSQYGRQTIVFRSGRVRLSTDTDGDSYGDAGGKKISC